MPKQTQQVLQIPYNSLANTMWFAKTKPQSETNVFCFGNTKRI